MTGVFLPAVLSVCLLAQPTKCTQQGLPFHVERSACGERHKGSMPINDVWTPVVARIVCQ